MSRSRRWVLRGAAVGFAVLLLLLAEAVLRVAGVADTPAWRPPRLVYVVQNGEVQGEFEVRAGAHFTSQPLGGQAGMRTSREYALGRGQGFPVNGAMRDEHFSTSPAPGVERLVVLGGSAAMGQAPIGKRGHGAHWQTERLPNGVQALPDSAAISGQLETLLTSRGRRAEVINAGMIAQDSAGVRRIAEEVLAFSPTALVLYLGNNEGIGLSAGMGGVDVPRLPAVQGALHKLRLYRALAELVVPARQRLAQAPTDRLQGITPEVLGRISVAQWQSAGGPLLRGTEPTDEVYLALLARFETNLRAIVSMAKAQDVDVYVIPTPPHLGYAPFFMSRGPTVSGADAQRFDAAFHAATQARQAGDLTRAIAEARTVTAIDPAAAAGFHLLGTLLDAAGQPDEAMDALLMAHALDLSRKRTQPAFNEVAAAVCVDLGCKTTNAHERLLAEARQRGLVSYNERFGDHEHLLPAGNAWVAKLFADLIVESSTGGG